MVGRSREIGKAMAESTTNGAVSAGSVPQRRSGLPLQSRVAVEMGTTSTPVPPGYWPVSSGYWTITLAPLVAFPGLGKNPRWIQRAA